MIKKQTLFGHFPNSCETSQMKYQESLENTKDVINTKNF